MINKLIILVIEIAVKSMRIIIILINIFVGSVGGGHLKLHVCIAADITVEVLVFPAVNDVQVLEIVLGIGLEILVLKSQGTAPAV